MGGENGENEHRLSPLPRTFRRRHGAPLQDTPVFNFSSFAYVLARSPQSASAPKPPKNMELNTVNLSPKASQSSSTAATTQQSSSSPTPSPMGTTMLVPSNSGKKKYVKQVTGRYKDTELHLAVRKGDLLAVKGVLGGVCAQLKGVEGFDADVVGLCAALVNEVNEVGLTALMIAAEKGQLDVVHELLKYCSEDDVLRKNVSGYNALHLASREGHQAIVQVLLNHYPKLSKSLGPSNATPLMFAVERGHASLVKEFLSRDSSTIGYAKYNGKNALHFAARKGCSDIVQALLDKDPQLAGRTDKKGQTALHMAVKGTNRDVVKSLVEADPAVVMLPDKFGNTVLHVATRKKRVEIVNVLLLLPGTHVNALTREHKTALDIAEGVSLSEESVAIGECLREHGAVRVNELNQPRDELRKTVTEIKEDVHTQLVQTRKTNKSVLGISKELRKLHREGINNATNSVTVVAVLFATVAFAALFTVPGGNENDGEAVAHGMLAFRVFFIFNALALFTSLAVVVVQITLVRGETRSERRVVGVINKLMWLASVCTSTAFIASSYIVVGRRFQWAAVLVTVIGGVIMAGVLGTMTYYVIKSKRCRSRSLSLRRRGNSRSLKNTCSTTCSRSWFHHSDFSDPDFKRIYAI